jgi:hypothetical protein
VERYHNAAARLILAILAAASAAAQTPDFAARIVEDSTGNPLPSAEVRFHRAGLREFAADLETDRTGRATATGLPPGDYSVEVLKPNFVTATLKLRIPAAAFTIRLVRHGVITGRVSDQTGQPLPAAIHAPYGKTIGGTRIAILSRDADCSLRLLRETAPAPNGRYRIFDLTPGQYAIGVWYDGLKDGSGFQLYPDSAHPRMFAISGGEEYDHVDFVIAPQPVFQLSGRVASANNEDTYKLALSLPEQPLLPIAQTLSEEGGAFKFDKIPAGANDLLVGGPDAGYSAHTTSVPANATYARVHLSVGQNIDNLSIPLAPGRPLAIAVHATTDCSATGPAGPAAFRFGVETQPSSGMSSTGGLYSLPPSGVTGPDGKFRVCDLTPGVYRFTAWQTAGGKLGDHAMLPFTITDRDLANSNVTLSPGPTLDGEVLLDGPAPAEPLTVKTNVSLGALLRSGLQGENFYVRSVIPGTFSFTGLVLSDYGVRVNINAPGFFVKSIDYAGNDLLNEPLHMGAAMEGVPLRVVIARDGATLSVVAADKDNQPAADMQVLIMPKEIAAEAVLQSALIRGATDQNGRYESHSLRPGKYYVAATDESFDPTPESISRLWRARNRFTEIELSASGTAQVTLQPITIE